MWQETTLLNNKSSGLYKAGSPLKALAAETFKMGFPSMVTVWLLLKILEVETSSSLVENQFNFALNKCLNPIVFFL